MKQTSLTLNTKAQANLCTPGNCLSEPPCCAQMVKDQDFRDCPWNENDATQNYRAFCLHSTCAQLPPGLENRGHCGWYWSFHEGYTNSPNGYGCMIGPDAEHMTPICSGGPTNGPNPTIPPTTSPPKPTKTPTPKPTNTAYPKPSSPNPTTGKRQPTITPSDKLNEPTTTPYQYPTNSVNPSLPPFGIPTASVQNENPIDNFQFFTLIENLITHTPMVPPIQPVISNTINSINNESPKVLDFFGSVFTQVVDLDKQLENEINSFLKH